MNTATWTAQWSACYGLHFLAVWPGTLHPLQSSSMFVKGSDAWYPRALRVGESGV